jgi:large subunit ribosomal protein L10
MRIEKATLDNQMSGIAAESDFLFCLSYKGLNVGAFSDFRARIFEAGASCMVVKNTLLHRAVIAKGVEIPAEHPFVGDTMIVYGKDDPVPVMKAIKEFTKPNQPIQVKCGILDTAYLDGAAAAQVADMPSKDQIFGQIVHYIKAPSSMLVQRIEARRASTVRILENWIHQQETVS